MNEDGFFDATVAPTYDHFHKDCPTGTIAETAQFLHEQAASGQALEFAIGTGRIALPLQELGTKVKGIELSNAMVSQLQKKQGGASIEVKIGDMTSVGFDEQFSLIYLVYNTIDNLTSQDAQLACFKNAAAHLKSGGRFVLETLVPQVQKLPFGERLLAFDHSDSHWGIDEIDITTQNYFSHHMHVDNGRARPFSAPFRYGWPAEFDLMAKFNGLELENRWSDFRKSDFTNTSQSHVSVWQKA